MNSSISKNQKQLQMNSNVPNANKENAHIMSFKRDQLMSQ